VRKKRTEDPKRERYSKGGSGRREPSLGSEGKGGGDNQKELGKILMKSLILGGAAIYSQEKKFHGFKKRMKGGERSGKKGTTRTRRRTGNEKKKKEEQKLWRGVSPTK